MDPQAGRGRSDMYEKSPKSYGASVALCGIFGLLGIHHFYIGNWVHGLFDLGLFVLFIVCSAVGFPVLGITALIVDVIHSLFIFYKLIVGEQVDGKGRLITWR